VWSSVTKEEPRIFFFSGEETAPTPRPTLGGTYQIVVFIFSLLLLIIQLVLTPFTYFFKTETRYKETAWRRHDALATDNVTRVLGKR
jgi:hypothetical protein